VTVGEGCVIGAGAVVVRKTAPGATYYAAPARRL
jgi:acetyltransferase-like isoleucine patch superfamily enzyme